MARRSAVGPGLPGPGLGADDRRNDARGTRCLGRRSHARRRDPVSPQGRGSRISAPARLRSDRARSRCGKELRTPDPPGPHPRRTSAGEARAGDVRRDCGPSLADTTCCATSSRTSGARSTTTSTCRPAPTSHIGCSTSYRSCGRSWSDHVRQRRSTTPSNVPVAASALTAVERRCSCMATFMKRTHSRQKVPASCRSGSPYADRLTRPVRWGVA
jgi:hypothetical protein